MVKHLFILTCVCLSFAFANPFVANKGVATATSTQSAHPLLIQYQQQLRSALSQGILAIKKSASFTGIAILLGVSFLYGLIHAAGPGHRKGVVFAYFLAKKATWLEPLVIGLALAIEHVLTSLLLVLGIQFFAGQLFQDSGTASMILENLAYAILAILGLVLLGLKARDIHCCHGHGHTHDHDGQKLATLFISGIIPCPATTLILIFCLIHKVLWLGLLIAIAISLGITVIVSLTGYFATYSQKNLTSWLGKNEAQREKIGNGIEVLGLISLVVMALYMLMPLLYSLR